MKNHYSYVNADNTNETTKSHDKAMEIFRNLHNVYIVDDNTAEIVCEWVWDWDKKEGLTL